MKLGEYMQRYIFDPLGINDMTFCVSEHQDMQRRLVQCWERSETEGMKKTRYSMRPQHVEEHFGGGGLYASATDLLKVYRAILQKDGRILGEELVDLMFTPQLQHTVGLDNLTNSPPPYRNSILNSIPSTTPINFGLGGLVNLQPVVGRRGSHSLTWSGVANCYWVRRFLPIES
jgi:CubicO group peptidase (beta-lactamase class C family)